MTGDFTTLAPRIDIPTMLAKMYESGPTSSYNGLPPVKTGHFEDVSPRIEFLRKRTRNRMSTTPRFRAFRRSCIKYKTTMLTVEQPNQRASKFAAFRPRSESRCNGREIAGNFLRHVRRKKLHDRKKKKRSEKKDVPFLTMFVLPPLSCFLVSFWALFWTKAPLGDERTVPDGLLCSTTRLYGVGVLLYNVDYHARQSKDQTLLKIVRSTHVHNFVRQQTPLNGLLTTVTEAPAVTKQTLCNLRDISNEPSTAVIVPTASGTKRHFFVPGKKKDPPKN